MPARTVRLFLDCIQTVPLMAHASCTKAFEAHSGNALQKSSERVVCETGIRHACRIAGYSDPLYTCLQNVGPEATATVYSSVRGKACGMRLSG